MQKKHKKIVAAVMIGAKNNDDRVFVKFGEPFLTDGSGRVTLNERAIAMQCATTHMIKYSPTGKTYERYDDGLGLWMTIPQEKVLQLVGDLLIKLGKKFEHEDVVQRSGSAKLHSLCRMPAVWTVYGPGATATT
jgi:hypothetical protein